MEKNKEIKNEIEIWYDMKWKKKKNISHKKILSNTPVFNIDKIDFQL